MNRAAKIQPDNFLSLLRRKPTARRIVLLFLSMEMLTVIVLGVVLYVNSTATIRNQAEINQEKMISQLSRSIDMIVDEVTEFMIRLQNDTDLMKLATADMNRDIEFLLEVNRNMISHLIVNDHIHSLVVYYPDRGAVYSPSFGIVPVSKYWDREFILSLDSEPRLPNWLPRELRIGPVSPGMVDVLTISRTLFYTRDDPIAYISLNINKNYLRSLADILLTDNYSNIQILNSEGVPILSESETGIEKGVNDFGGNLITEYISYDSSWTYISRVSFEYLYSNVRIVRNLFIILLSVTFISGTILAMIFSNSIMRPVISLAHLLSQEAIIHSAGDIYQQINQRVQGLVTENRELDALVKLQYPLLRRAFIDSILSAKLRDRVVIENNITYYDIQLPKQGKYQVLSIQIDSETHELPSLSTVNANPSRLLAVQTVSDIVRKMTDAEVIEREPGEIVVLMGASQPIGEESISAMCNEIKGFLFSLYRAPCSIGVGDVQNDILDIHRSFSEAQRSVRVARFYGEEVTYFNTDTKTADVPMLTSLVGDEKKILVEIKKGNTDTARIYLKSYIENAGLVSSPDDRNARIVLLRLLFSIQQTLDDLGISMKDLGREEDLAFEILGTPGIDTMYELLDHLLMDVGNYLEAKKNPAKQELVKRIEAHVQTHFSEDVSLTRLADLVHLSVPYLSRLYKDTTGTNLKDFINGIRIAESKKLLSTSDLRINEIGTLVGYPNAHGFLKFFKTHTGTTPRKYRSARILDSGADRERDDQ